MKHFVVRFWPIMLLLLIWCVFSSPYIGKGLIPFPSRYLVSFFPPWSALYGMPVKNNAMPDIIGQIYPWKHLTIATWKLGQVPLWNPYSFGGTPHAGNYQSAVFSPMNILFFMLPEVHAWSLLILLQPLMAGFFMYICLRSFLLSREASVLGSVAFMFCGFITVWMAYGTLAYAALFLPLSLYSINRYLSGQRWQAVLLSISVAFSFVSGHFQISLYVFSYIIFYLCFRVVASKTRARVFPLFAFLGAGILLAAPQIFPAMSAYAASGRSSSFGKGEIIPWSYLITLFSPDFYGNPVTRNDWFGHYAEWASFIGVTPLLLVSLAFIMKHKDRLVWFFGSVALICLVLALPTPLNDLMYSLHIPVLSTSSASRIILLVSFSFCALAAIGADTLLAFWQRRFRSIGLLWILSGCIALVVFWVSLKALHPLPAEKLMVAIRNSYLPSAMFLATVFIIGLGFFIPKQWRKYLIFFCILITSFDLLRYAIKWMPFEPKEFVYPSVPVLKQLSERVVPTHRRIEGNIYNEVTATIGVPSLEGYDAVYQKRYGQFISTVTDGTVKPLERSVVSVNKQGKYTEEILKLLGVRYVVHRISDGRFGWAYPYWQYPQYQSVWKDSTYEILENTQAYPRAFLASSYVVAKSDAEILQAILKSDMNRRETLVLETEIPVKPQEGSGSADMLSYTPTRIAIQTNAGVPKLLFLSDVFDPGWHAAVDGVAAPIYRADFDFRAIMVPAGTHTVSMWYWPVSETLGLIAFGFGTLWCVGYLFMGKRT